MNGIISEILKCGGDTIDDLLKQVIHDVWECEVPQHWSDAILGVAALEGFKVSLWEF